MNYSQAYSLPSPLLGLMGQNSGGFVCDADTPLSTARLELESHIRSGDYFSTLATTLDTLIERVGSCNAPEAAQLTAIVEDLLYIDRCYQLTKR